MTETLAATQPIDLVVSPQSFDIVREFLENNGIAYVIAIPDLQKSVTNLLLVVFRIMHLQ